MILSTTSPGCPVPLGGALGTELPTASFSPSAFLSPVVLPTVPVNMTTAFLSPMVLPRAPARRLVRTSTAPVCKRPPTTRTRKAKKSTGKKKAAAPSPTKAPPPAKMPKAGKRATSVGSAAARFGPCLVLNADFQPLSLMPLSLVSWQESIKAVYSNRVSVVATYPSTFVRSPNAVFPLPSVVCLKKYKATATNKVAAFSRFNLSLRDRFRCQYCDTKLATHEVTFDHVLPRCMGGETSWSNVVAACERCNHRKGRKLLRDISDMRLARKPVSPTNGDLQRRARDFPPQVLHDTWRSYLYWTEEMMTGKTETADDR